MTDGAQRHSGEGLSEDPVGPVDPVDPRALGSGLSDVGGHRHDPSSIAFAPLDSDAYSTPPRLDASLAPVMAPYPAQRGYTPTAGVESAEFGNTSSSGLCETMSKARRELISRFKDFLAKTFKGMELNVDFSKLSFSVVNGEKGQFVRVEGLMDHSVFEGEGSVQFFALCLTEGLRPVQNDGQFDIEIPVDDFDGKSAVAPAPAAVPAVFPGQEVTKMHPFRAGNPGAVSVDVQGKVSGIVPGEDGGHGLHFYGDRDEEESAGFDLPPEKTK